MKYAILLSALLLSFGVNAAEPANFAHIQYTFRDTIGSDSDNPNRQGVNFTYGRTVLPGITFDVNQQFRTERLNSDDGKSSTRLETGVRLDHALTEDIGFYTRAAIGQKFSTDQDNTYYSIEPGFKAQVLDKLSMSVGYRFRDSFNSNVDDKTNTFRVASEYSLDKTQSMTLGFDRAYGDSESFGVNAGYRIKF